jgi:hypothetical protein
MYAYLFLFLTIRIQYQIYFKYIHFHPRWASAYVQAGVAAQQADKQKQARSAPRRPPASSRRALGVAAPHDPCVHALTMALHIATARSDMTSNTILA